MFARVLFDVLLDWVRASRLKSFSRFSMNKVDAHVIFSRGSALSAFCGGHA